MSVEFFKAGREELAKEIKDIIDEENKNYTDGAYRFHDDVNEYIISRITTRCKSILDTAKKEAANG